MQSSANFKLLFYVNYIEKPKIKKEKPGMAPFLKKPQAEKTFDLVNTAENAWFLCSSVNQQFVKNKINAKDNLCNH